MTLSLKDLLEQPTWQIISDNFAALTNVGIRTLDFQGVPFTSFSHEPRLCSKLRRNHWAKQKICDDCLPTFLGGNKTVDKNLSFSCLAGLYNFITPLRAGGRVFGYVIVGPVVLVMRKPKEAYVDIAEELNIELEDFWSSFLEIKVTSLHGIQSIIELIKEICEYSLRVTYQQMAKAEEAIILDSPELNRIWDALLGVAFQVSRAEVGSIMLVDKDKKELTIRISQGLSDEVVKNTRVRLGNGISGMAAEEGRPFLIDDNIQDNRIKQYLNRPSIVSSMVIPIKVEDKVLGVMNLGAVRNSDVRFNSGSVKAVNNLVDLATMVVNPQE